MSMSLERRKERHSKYFQIGEHATENIIYEWGYWKEMFGYTAYSTESVKRWMKWYRYFGAEREQAVGLYAKALDALCQGDYSQQVRLNAFHDMLLVQDLKMTSEEARCHAIACLESAREQEALGILEPVETVEVKQVLTSLRKQVEGLLNKVFRLETQVRKTQL